MTLEQIKASVLRGNRVCWSSHAYTVKQDSAGQWLIVCTHNGSVVGLTTEDGQLNGQPGDFFIVA